VSTTSSAIDYLPSLRRQDGTEVGHDAERVVLALQRSDPQQVRVQARDVAECLSERVTVDIRTVFDLPKGTDLLWT
jgi:hypothetical protein